MSFTPLVLAALIGCPTPESRTVRAEGTAPAWIPTADPRSGVDTAAPGEEAPPTVCFDVPEVDGIEIEATFQGTSWLPAGPDFDFDAEGFVVTAVGDDLVRFDEDGVGEIVLRGPGPVWAVRSLPSGELAFTRPEHGMAALVDAGQPRPFLGGLIHPTALEVGRDGMVYVADEVPDGRVWMADPHSGEVEEVFAGPFPSGLALSPGEETLYVAVSNRPYGGPGRILAMARDADGRWDASTARVVLRTASRVGAMTTDVCGNLYVGEHDTARVLRVRVGDDELVEQVAVFEGAVGTSEQPGPMNTQDFDPWGLTALRFGAGAGDFPADTLFTSAGGMLYAMPIGVAGRHVLSGP